MKKGGLESCVECVCVARKRQRGGREAPLSLPPPPRPPPSHLRPSPFPHDQPRLFQSPHPEAALATALFQSIARDSPAPPERKNALPPNCKTSLCVDPQISESLSPCPPSNPRLVRAAQRPVPRPVAHARHPTPRQAPGRWRWTGARAGALAQRPNTITRTRRAGAGAPAPTPTPTPTPTRQLLLSRPKTRRTTQMIRAP
jgi:hypothetical protein